MGILGAGWKATISEDPQGLIELVLERPNGKVKVRWLTPAEANEFALKLLKHIWGKEPDEDHQDLQWLWRDG